MLAAARYDRLLPFILLLGLLLRLAYALSLPTVSEFTGAGGGDSSWFLANGYGFFSGQVHGRVNGITFYNGTLPTPPLYIIFTGLVQGFLPKHETVVVLRLLQCLAGIAIVWLTARIALILTDDRRVCLLGAGLSAFHPAMVMESGNIATETLYIFFLALALWLYTDYFLGARLYERPSHISARHALALAALALGLATLTRAVAVLFPLALAGHLLLLGQRKLLANWRRDCLLLLLVYAALVSTWTLHNLALWDRLVIVSDQLLGAVWRGAEVRDGSPQENDALLLAGVEPPDLGDCQIDCGYSHPAELYLQKISDIVGADPARFLLRRVGELGYSLLQPHGTTTLGDVSVWDAAREWLHGDRSPEGLLDLLRIEGFASKLLVWAFHDIALVFGALGMWWWRKRWQIALPLAGFVLYTLAAHLALLAEPRYLFPIEFALIVFAGAALAQVHDNWRKPGGSRA